MKRIWPLGMGILLGACAHVDIQRIDADGNKKGPAGLRFYMPRPYVDVYEPFVIGSEICVVNGEVTPDGEYVVLNHMPCHGESWDFIQADSNRIATARIIPRESLAPSDASSIKGRPQGGGGLTGTPEGAPATGSQPVAPPSGGILNLKSKTDNNGFAVTPTRRYFDILWLPDFDERYVVTARAGLGNASVDLTLGQGWNLQAIEANVDNSAIVNPILKSYASTFDALTTLMQGKLGLTKTITGAPQGGGAVTEKGPLAASTPVSVKITIAEVAAPGIYPILKPDEYDKVKGFEGKGVGVHIPHPPLTNVAFNTYKVVVIEAARAKGDSPLNLQRFFDSDSPAPPVTKANTGSPAATETSKVALDKAKAKANEALASKKDGDGHFWIIDSLKAAAGGAIQVIYKASESPVAIDRSEVIDAVAAATGAAKEKVLASEQTDSH